MVALEPTSEVPPLTPKAIEAARPKERDYELGDGGAPGLRLRVTPKSADGRRGGAKVFRWYVNVGGVQRKITIGRWSKEPRPGHVTLADARKWLERLKAAHREGRLPEAEAELRAARPTKIRERPPTGAPALTVGQVATDFLDKYIERRRRRPEYARRPIEYDINPAIGDRPIASVTPTDCRQIVEAVVARGSPTQAGAVLAVLRQLFNFAWARGDIAMNPTAPLRDPAALGVVKNVCQRFLSPVEITMFWNGLDAYKGMSPTVRNGLKLLLLLGVRSGELLQARWEEVDFDDRDPLVPEEKRRPVWTVPVAHQKLTKRQEQTARPWAVPLSSPAVALFRELKALADSMKSPFVMASFHGEGAATTEKALNHAMRRLFVGSKPLLEFSGERPTPHDLRRTMRTHLGDVLGVAWHIAERCLNHSLGKIATTYDVGDYLAERRVALEKWGAYVLRLVRPAEASVLFLAAAGA